MCSKLAFASALSESHRVSVIRPPLTYEQFYAYDRTGGRREEPLSDVPAKSPTASVWRDSKCGEVHPK